MFTGLIRELGVVKSLNGDVLSIQAAYRPKLGDSIAINGVCLTVVNVFGGGFDVEIGAETRAKVSIKNLKDEVHIEPAMRLADRLDGHIVQGHIDTIGHIASIDKVDNIYKIGIQVYKEYMKYIVPKGSIAIDGVSLTVNEVENDIFYIGIIPHTYNNTIFKDYTLNRAINIETDLFARYVENIINHRKSANSWEKIDNILSMY